ncbi:MAG TPA: RsmE family RNA methyltransferase [candidate division Zixibacteria bacterium]|nr:RsmE family RNA methyltransferase [candidate division Zixibacteria bacterium]
MTLHRFFVNPDEVVGDFFPIPAGIRHQVTHVLRLHSGERLMLLDGQGQALVVRLEGHDCRVEERLPAAGEARHRLTVWQALLRGDHLEPVIRHGTELGVHAFRLFVSDRCVAREVSARRLERLRTIAREAAEQSERGAVPEVSAPIPFAEALRAAGAEPSVLLYERADGPRLSAVEPPRGVVIGPEGGFTPDEVAAAEAAGLTVAGLGPRILRSESVALAVAAVVMSRTGDFA